MTERRPRPRTVLTVYRKEIVDALRDRRTLLTMLLVPMVAYPLALLYTLELAALERRSSEARTSIVLVEATVPQRVAESIDDTRLKIRRLNLDDPIDTASARRLLGGGGGDVILAASATSAAALERLGAAQLVLYYDKTNVHSADAIDRLSVHLRTLNVDIRDERMRGLDLDPTTAVPLNVERVSTATRTEIANRNAAIYLPVLILFFIALTSFYPAVDLTAGEKERGTIATLLTAPIHATEVIWGKYLTVLTIGLLAGTLNVVVVTSSILRMLGDATGGAAAPSLEASSIAALLLGAGTVAALLAAIMLSCALLARSFRDASNLMAPVMLLTLAPAALVVMPGIEMNIAWAAVPLFNAVLLMKSGISGTVSGLSALTVVLSTLVYLSAMLGFAARLLADERTLFASEGPRANFRALIQAPPQPGSGVAFIFAALLFVGNYYGALLPLGGPLGRIVTMQIVVHLGGGLALLAWLDAASRARLRLRTPTRNSAYLNGVLVGIGAWFGVALPIAWLMSALLGGPHFDDTALRESLGLDSHGLLLLIIAFAIVPAVAEEFAFRGLIQGLLERRLSPMTALMTQAGLFALMHGSPSRILPTFALGLIMGVLARRTGSIGPGIVAHALCNICTLVADRYFLALFQTPSALPLIGVLLLGVGLVTTRDKS